jgi:Spy/CpxP family protein refolding chaperone
MKNLVAVVTLAILLTPMLLAYGDGKDQKLGEQLAGILRCLNLTAPQKAKIAQIETECQPKIQGAANALAILVREEADKVRDALTRDQVNIVMRIKEDRKLSGLESLATRIARLQDLDLTEDEVAQMKEIREGFRPRIDEVIKEFKTALSDEQRRAWEEAARLAKDRAAVLNSFNPREDQKELMDTLGQGLRPILKEELGMVREVLAKEQQAKLPALSDRPRARTSDRWAHTVCSLEKLNLTDEQRSKIDNIRQEYRVKIHEAGNKLRAAVWKELDQIVAVIK